MGRTSWWLMIFRWHCKPNCQEFETWSNAYERQRYRYTETNARIGAATRGLFMGWFPAPVRPLVRRVIHAMLDEPLLDAFGFDHPSAFLRSSVAFTMRSRAQLLRWLPGRQRPVLRTALIPRSYPKGYEIARVGPESFEVNAGPGE
jgi:hypothetical protein